MFAFIGVTIAVFFGVGVFVWKGNELGHKQNPQSQVAQILQNGIDTSHSLFTPDETQIVLGKAQDRADKFLSGSDATAQNLMDLARLVRDLRDYDKALDLFHVVDTMNAPDLFYKVDEGNIYLERQQWEDARQLYEPLRQTFPIHEIFIGLAEAYKHIEGTPDYVIEDIYKEGEWRTLKFEVYEAHAKWLESKGREQETIPLYEYMNQLAPQPIIENKLKELKAKYAK